MSNSNTNNHEAKPLVKSLVNWLSNNKKVSKPNHSVQDVITIVLAIEAVNALGEYDSQCGGVHLNDCMLPKWAECFILPKKIAIQNHSQAADIAIRPEIEADFFWDQAAIHNAVTRIASSLKKDPVLVPVSSMRRDVVMLSEIDYYIDDAVPTYRDNFFVPIPVDERLSDFVNMLSADTPSHVFQMFMATKFSMD